MLPHFLTNIYIQRHYQNKSKCKGVYSQNILLNVIEDVAYVVYLDGRKSTGTRWAALNVNDNITSFGAEYVPEEMKAFIGNIITNIYRMQPYDSVMCGYFCIDFIKFIFKTKTLTDRIYIWVDSMCVTLNRFFFN